MGFIGKQMSLMSLNLQENEKEKNKIYIYIRTFGLDRLPQYATALETDPSLRFTYLEREEKFSQST
jgi:hypothetical protein